MSKRRKQHPQHVRVYQWEMRSPAWQSLSTDARALLLEFRALYAGRENRVYLSVREMMARLHIGQRRAQKARDELIERGFVRLIKHGSFGRKVRHASEYALTNEPLDGQDGPAPLDYMRWGKKKSTVAVATTDGSRSDYRGTAGEAKKKPHGSRSDYREARNSAGHGSCHGCAGRLPTPTRKTPPPGWEVRGQTWRSRVGLLLDTQCATCRVWITNSGDEFDGRRHRCDPVSAAAWRARRDEQAERGRAA